MSMILYQNFCCKFPERRHRQSVDILQLCLQQRVTQSPHTTAGKASLSVSLSLQRRRYNTWSDGPLTISAVRSAALPRWCAGHLPTSGHFSLCYSRCSVSPRRQMVGQNLWDRCNTGRAWTHHRPLAPSCSVQAAWPPGPRWKTGSCPRTRPCDCQGTSALGSERREEWNDITLSSIPCCRFRSMLYLSEVGSTADGSSLLWWSYGRLAPVVPEGQSAALWVCMSGKSQMSQFLVDSHLDQIFITLPAVRPVASGWRWPGTESGFCPLSSEEPGTVLAADSSPYILQCPTERNRKTLSRATRTMWPKTLHCTWFFSSRTILRTCALFPSSMHVCPATVKRS